MYTWSPNKLWRSNSIFNLWSRAGYWPEKKMGTEQRMYKGTNQGIGQIKEQTILKMPMSKGRSRARTVYPGS